MSLTEAMQSRERGTALLGRGLLVAAGEEFQHWLIRSELTGEAGQVIAALNGLTAVATTRGDLDAALSYLRRAAVLTEVPGVPGADKLKVYLNLMMIKTDLGLLDQALESAGKAASLLEDPTSPLTLAYWLNLSLLHWRRLEWESMRQASDTAYVCSREIGDVISSCKALTNRGIAYLELGDHTSAERDFRDTLRLGGDEHSLELAYTYAELGRLHFQRGDLQLALDAGREALHLLVNDVAVLDKEEVARVSRLFGAIFSTLGQRNLALKYLNRSAAYYSQLGLRAEWQRATEAIGQVLSTPVRPARSQLRDEAQQLDFLTAILDMTDDLESVDPYLRGHSERVASLAVVLAEEIGLDEPEIRILNHAARLHDVGMVAVDAELISREGPLTDAELKRVAMHSVIGEEMLRPYLDEAGLKAIRHHHEHFGGNGSPDGLQGEAIPLLARIVAVADVYDALTSERIYRGALSHGGAVEVLKRMAGGELDPRLVDTFLSLHEF